MSFAAALRPGVRPLPGAVRKPPIRQCLVASGAPHGAPRSALLRRLCTRAPTRDPTQHTSAARDPTPLQECRLPSAARRSCRCSPACCRGWSPPTTRLVVALARPWHHAREACRCGATGCSRLDTAGAPRRPLEAVAPVVAPAPRRLMTAAAPRRWALTQTHAATDRCCVHALYATTGALSPRLQRLTRPPPAPPPHLVLSLSPQLPDQGVVTKFHALRPPSIGVRDYLER